MTMNLCPAKLPPSLAARIEAQPDLLKQVWREEAVVDSDIVALDEGTDMLMEDFLHLGRILQE